MHRSYFHIPDQFHYRNETRTVWNIDSLSIYCELQSYKSYSFCNCMIFKYLYNIPAYITGRHYSHPKYRIARSCGSLPGQSSPAAAAGHREAKSSRQILPTELQLEPLLSLLLQTLLVHAQYVPWPQLVTRLPLQTTSSQKVCNCCHPMNSYYCYGCHQSANNSISRQKHHIIDTSYRS